jgi:type IV pilus secretin PilQ/predicted competence protein
MTVTRGIALLLTVAAAGALVDASAPGPAATGVRLKAITSRLHSNGASLVIEVSEPVAYTATRPDPLTVVLELRNVTSDDVANSVVASAASPIADVSIEPARSMGAETSRVRIALVQPVAHHVRSDRNTIVIDFDRPSARGAPFVLPPSSRGRAPDAMLALQNAAAVDPIAALGLDAAAGGPSAAAPYAAPAPATIAVPSILRTPAPPLHSQTPVLQTPGAAASAPAPQADQIGPVRSSGRQFTGHPISLDFQGADLRAVLRTFSEISGLNIVIDPAVQGTVDVALKDVPWDQALDIILRANKLGYFVDGTIVRIAPLTVLADEESQRRKLGEEQALAGQLEVLTKTLSYAKAADLLVLLTKTVLSSRGTVQVDPRTNTLIISDLRDRLTLATDLLATLDRPQPQVEIEARVINTNRNYARALGVQWGFGGRVDPALGNTTNLAFPNNGSLGGTAGGGSTAAPNAVNLAPTGATSGVGLALGSINGAFNLDVALSALESSGNGRILSTPRVTTQNNVEAEIAQGLKIPVTVQATVGSPATVTYVDAALLLKVTPQITAAGTVIMKISVDNGSANPQDLQGNRSINTQRASTTLLVGDGQTTVIGGIYSSTNAATNDRTPGLGRVPFLKWLFKRDTVTDSNTELLIFITPRIIKG